MSCSYDGQAVSRQEQHRQRLGNEERTGGPGSGAVLPLKRPRRSQAFWILLRCQAPTWNPAGLSPKPSFLLCQLEYSVSLNTHVQLGFSLN